ncbi:hypothetical protein LV89_04464 [Arcicella aurantiaca]|uniref:Uncharacterized protein n=1 Tax=Arcicella aurantiaca TaxID=591202 RepID=A0A316DHQ8_9BACT|nr:hypothetical protein LV89_04464 [Arcicella aurantiaca]
MISKGGKTCVAYFISNWFKNFNIDSVSIEDYNISLNFINILA